MREKKNLPALNSEKHSTISDKLLVYWRIRQAYLPLPPFSVAYKLQRATQVREHCTIQHWMGEWGRVHQQLLSKIVGELSIAVLIFYVLVLQEQLKVKNLLQLTHVSCGTPKKETIC